MNKMKGKQHSGDFWAYYSSASTLVAIKGSLIRDWCFCSTNYFDHFAIFFCFVIITLISSVYICYNHLLQFYNLNCHIFIQRYVQSFLPQLKAFNRSTLASSLVSALSFGIPSLRLPWDRIENHLYLICIEL